MVCHYSLGQGPLYFCSAVDNTVCEGSEEIEQHISTPDMICYTETMFIFLIAFFFGCFLGAICLRFKHEWGKRATRNCPDVGDFYEDEAEHENMNTSRL